MKTTLVPLILKSAVIACMVAMSCAASADTIISGMTATASSQIGAAVAYKAVNPADLTADNQNIGSDYTQNWLSNSPAGDQWIYVDLGATYDLSEVRLWNYHEIAGGGEANGRGIDACEIFVAGPGATLPTAPAATPFTVDGG